MLLSLMLLAGVAWAQLPATGLRTDVVQTSLGELHITPLDGPSFLLTWAGRAIYVDPVKAADFQGGWPKADLILLTGAGPRTEQGAVAVLHKRSTQIVAPGTIARGDTGVLTLPGAGKPVRAAVEAVSTTAPSTEQGYVLRLGNTRLYISGPTPCAAGQLLSTKVTIAFVGLTTQPAITPQAAALCVLDLAPQDVYPYLEQDNAG